MMKNTRFTLLLKPVVTAAALHCSAINLQAQDLDVQLNPSQFDNGYNVPCNGAANGSIRSIPVNGHSPYAFLWSNGATTQDVSNLPAGVYTLTVTDWDNNTTQRSIELSQPDALEINLVADEFPGGTNISEEGGNDGHIRAEIGGGAPPYSYLWSNASEGEEIGDIPTGIYTLSVTDVNGCSSSNSITLTEPSQLHIASITSPLHHGKNISCKGGDDGAVDITVTGGIPPYTYQWNNGSFDEDPQNLRARLYMVRVFDQNGAETDGQITLTEPSSRLDVGFTVSQYGNYNISAYGGSNGYINSNVTGGTAPYTYQWGAAGPTTVNISNLGPGDYPVIVTDANNCLASNRATLTQPNFSGWSQDGNANTDPANQFIGTTDNTDFSFRTNNLEALRIKANGDLKINSFAGGTGSKMILSDSLGNISSQKIIIPYQPCFSTSVMPWIE
ncbi:MAG: SprB repeat-containing protein [Bacteroidota bacterium]